MEDLDDSVLLDAEIKEEPTEEDYSPPKPKAKRVLSEKQKEALARGREKGRARLNEKNSEINEKKQARQQELERLRNEAETRVKNLVVKKAVQIKKKEMLAQVELDDIESDGEDIPIEAIRKVVAKSKAKRAPAQAKPTQSKNQFVPIHHYNPTQAFSGIPTARPAGPTFNFV